MADQYGIVLNYLGIMSQYLSQFDHELCCLIMWNMKAVSECFEVMKVESDFDNDRDHYISFVVNYCSTMFA